MRAGHALFVVFPKITNRMATHTHTNRISTARRTKCAPRSIALTYTLACRVRRCNRVNIDENWIMWTRATVWPNCSLQAITYFFFFFYLVVFEYWKWYFFRHFTSECKTKILFLSVSWSFTFRFFIIIIINSVCSQCENNVFDLLKRVLLQQPVRACANRRSDGSGRI